MLGSTILERPCIPTHTTTMLGCGGTGILGAEPLTGVDMSIWRHISGSLLLGDEHHFTQQLPQESQLAKMSNAQETKQALIEHKVITDVLPGNLDLAYDLTVKWPKTVLNKPGEELGREETQPEPTLYLHPTVCQNGFVQPISVVFLLLIHSHM
jgi:hypothetical protein